MNTQSFVSIIKHEYFNLYEMNYFIVTNSYVVFVFETFAFFTKTKTTKCSMKELRKAVV